MPLFFSGFVLVVDLVSSAREEGAILFNAAVMVKGTSEFPKIVSVSSWSSKEKPICVPVPNAMLFLEGFICYIRKNDHGLRKCPN